MRAIKKYEHYLAFSIDEIGKKNLNSLIQCAFKISNKLSVDELLDFEETHYAKTQIPYSSGYIQNRFLYFKTNSLTNYVLKAVEQKNAFDDFFCHYLCWDFYDHNTLILSLNIVEGIVSVHSLAIDLTNYDNYLEGDFGDE
jgi:hypothetical protein